MKPDEAAPESGGRRQSPRPSEEGGSASGGFHTTAGDQTPTPGALETASSAFEAASSALTTAACALATASSDEATASDDKATASNAFESASNAFESASSALTTAASALSTAASALTAKTGDEVTATDAFEAASSAFEAASSALATAGSELVKAAKSCGAGANEPVPQWTSDSSPPTQFLRTDDLCPAVSYSFELAGLEVPKPTLKLPGFVILECIGQGGMGTVYRAIQLSLKREVAIKVLRPHLLHDPRHLRRFYKEANLLGSLMGSGILPVIDILEHDGLPMLVMPYVNGWNLERIIRERSEATSGVDAESAEALYLWPRISDTEYLAAILPLLDKVADAVAFIHAAGVIHRDIKPSNVLVDRLGAVWLSDFGLSRLIDDSGSTTVGPLAGSPGYMSPEHWEGSPEINQRADVFSMGATLYQALTLALPYGKYRIGEEAAPPRHPSDRQPLLAADYDGVVLKALALEPENRYASAGEFRTDWRHARFGKPC